MARHNIHHEKDGRFVPKASPEAAAALRRAPPRQPLAKPYSTGAEARESEPEPTGNPGSRSSPGSLGTWARAHARG